jgi:hypothetical protein
MLDLRRDLYARLVISAHRDRFLNRPFRVRHVDMPQGRFNASVKKILEETPLEKQVSQISDVSKVQSGDNLQKIRPLENSSSEKSWPIKPVIVEKIDEKVDKIITDPRISEIKMDLEVAEALLKKIKDVDAHNTKIPVLEQTIIRLKAALEQKSYV